MLDIKTVQKEKKEVRKLKTLAEIAAERGFPFMAIKERDTSKDVYPKEHDVKKKLYSPTGTVIFVYRDADEFSVYTSHSFYKEVGGRVYKHARAWRG